jgi:hypothetical protein
MYVPLATNQSIKSNQSVDHITLGKQKIREANQFNINTVHNDQTVGVQKKLLIIMMVRDSTFHDNYLV